MELEELKQGMAAQQAQAPVAAPVFPPWQSLANHQERTVALKAQDAGPIVTPGKKVAVLGFTDTWRAAPFDDPNWEIWGLNELYLVGLPRWTRWFEIHQRAVYEADKKRTADHIHALRAMTCPVYMIQRHEDIPGSVPYPLAEIMAAFPNPAPGGRTYLTNTISYMIALAIYEGFQEIAVCGVDMAHATEYQQQRPSCEYFIGIAQGRGIKVTLPPQCELLLLNHLYGYETEQAERWNARMQARETDLNNKIGQLDNQIAQAMEARAQYRGALQDTQHLRQNWQALLSS